MVKSILHTYSNQKKKSNLFIVIVPRLLLSYFQLVSIAINISFWLISLIAFIGTDLNQHLCQCCDTLILNYSSVYIYIYIFNFGSTKLCPTEGRMSSSSIKDSKTVKPANDPLFSGFSYSVTLYSLNKICLGKKQHNVARNKKTSASSVIKKDEDAFEL